MVFHLVLLRQAAIAGQSFAVATHLACMLAAFLAALRQTSAQLLEPEPLSGAPRLAAVSSALSQYSQAEGVSGGWGVGTGAGVGTGVGGR